MRHPRGISRAAGFVDDDNVLNSDYLAEVVRIDREWPQLGVWGSGATVPEYEVRPPDHLKELLPWLALRETTGPLWSNVPSCREAAPWGAGLCVRAKVAAAYGQSMSQSAILISGRSGRALLSGEDVEISIVACNLGLGMGVFPELKLIHLIPKERISENYLLKLFEGTTTSDQLLAYKWQGVNPVIHALFLACYPCLGTSLFFVGCDAVCISQR